MPDPDETCYVADESDVQNAMNRGFLRQKVCDKMPTRAHRYCTECLKTLQTDPCADGPEVLDDETPLDVSEADPSAPGTQLVRKSQRVISKGNAPDSARTIAQVASIPESQSLQNTDKTDDLTPDEDEELVCTYLCVKASCQLPLN